MQTKKEDIEQRIIEVATDEFMKKDTRTLQ